MPTSLTASGSDPCNATFSASVSLYSPSVDVPRHALLERNSSREDWKSSMSECGSIKISWRLPFRSTDWGRLGFCTHQIMADLHPALIKVWWYSNSVGSIGPKWTANKISHHKTWRLQPPSCNMLGQIVEGVVENNKICPAKIRMIVKIINPQYSVPRKTYQPFESPQTSLALSYSHEMWIPIVWSCWHWRSLYGPYIIGLYYSWFHLVLLATSTSHYKPFITRYLCWLPLLTSHMRQFPDTSKHLSKDHSAIRSNWRLPMTFAELKPRELGKIAKTYPIDPHWVFFHQKLATENTPCSDRMVYWLARDG